MATKVLKDVITCTCGKVMFPAKFDKESRVIGYKCVDELCGSTVEMSFEEAELPENENFKYFCLNDDGQMTWKCFNHGYCDFDMEWFEIGWQDKVKRFMELGCALDTYMEEIQGAFGDSDEQIEELKELFHHLDEEQIQMIADEMGVMCEDDIYTGFCSDFEEGLMDGSYGSWDEYKDMIISTMFDLELCEE